MDIAEDRKVKAKGQAIWLYVYFGKLSLAACARVRACVSVHTFWACHSLQGRCLTGNITSAACHHEAHRRLVVCNKALLTSTERHIL